MLLPDVESALLLVDVGNVLLLPGTYTMYSMLLLPDVESALLPPDVGNVLLLRGTYIVCCS